MKFSTIFTAVPFQKDGHPQTSRIRVFAIILAITCLAISLVLLNRYAFLGFVVGGWTGSPEYRQALAAAQVEQKKVEIELLVIQVLGGVAATWGFSRRQTVLHFFWKIPLFIFLFCVTTVLICIFIVEIVSSIHHHLPLK